MPDAPPVVRRLPALLRDSGFEPVRTRSHGYIESGDAGCMLSIVDRGADMLHAAGEIGDELAPRSRPRRAAGRPPAAGSATSRT
jgi:hypothetical protein